MDVTLLLQIKVLISTYIFEILFASTNHST